MPDGSPLDDASHDAGLPDPGLPDAALPAPALPDPGLTEYAPLGTVALDDAARWPTLDAAGAARLAAVAQDPAAPVWVHRTGDRLLPGDLADLERAARRLAAPPSPTAAAAPPAWVADLVARAHAQVPAYRRRARAGLSSAGTALADLPTVDREDLRRRLADHVPLDVPLDRVLEGTSSGSTGAALRIPLHPVAVAADVVLLHHLVARAGAAWRPEADRLGLANVVDQRAAFTYTSAMTGFPRADDEPVPVMARLNLDDGAWRRPGDREAFLARHDPQVLSSSPLPLLRLVELARSGLALHPVAVVSGAAHLTPAVRAVLTDVWPVPVLDLYGLRETGPLAARADDGPHVVVPRRVWVEVLGPDGAPRPDGERGEIVVTTDENPYLPLLRYRTGDHGALVRRGDGVVELHGLTGRAPVRLRHRDGSWRPSVDATQVLQTYGVAAWELHQAADGAVRLAALPAAPGTGAGRAAAHDAARAVERLLDRPVDLVVLEDPGAFGGAKPRLFTSDVDPVAST